MAYKELIKRRDVWIKRTSFLNALFVGQNGQVAILQWPNIPLSLWAILRVASWFTAGRIHLFTDRGASLFLLIWAVIEIGWGDSLFRRILGTIITVETLYWLLKMIVK